MSQDSGRVILEVDSQILSARAVVEARHFCSVKGETYIVVSPNARGEFIILDKVIKVSQNQWLGFGAEA